MIRKTRMLLAIGLASSSVAMAGKKHCRPWDNGYQNGKPATQEGREALRKRQTCKLYASIVDKNMREATTQEEKQGVYDILTQPGAEWDCPMLHRVLEKVLRRHPNKSPKQPELYRTIDGEKKLPPREWYVYFRAMVRADFTAAKTRQEQQKCYNSYEEHRNIWSDYPRAVEIFKEELKRCTKK